MAEVAAYRLAIVCWDFFRTATISFTTTAADIVIMNTWLQRYMHENAFCMCSLCLKLNIRRNLFSLNLGNLCYLR